MKIFTLKLTVSTIALSGLTFMPAFADENESYTLEEITVTAQKRSQSVNDIPLSVQAFSGNTLQNNGVSDAASLVQITPGMTFAKSATNTPIFSLRGIGFNTTNLSSTSPVGIYMDEIAYAYPYMANGALFDIERVEVLKGPQGTLYGRNTTGGLINFIANKATNEFEAGLTTELGNYKTSNFEGYINLPLTENVAFRLSGRYELRNTGYQKSVTRPSDRNGEKDTLAFRAILNWDASEDLEVNISASYWRDKSDTIAGQIVGTNYDQPDFVHPDVAALSLNREWTNDTADWDAGGDPLLKPFKSDSNFYSVAARINYNLNDQLQLVSLTAYNQVIRKDVNDLDGSAEEIFYLDSDGRVRSFSQEFRIVGDYDKIHFIIGAYYSKDKIKDNQVGSYEQSSQNQFLRFAAQNVIDPTNSLYSREEYAGGFRFFRLKLKSENTSKSIFTKIDYDINDQFQISLGLRYTDDKLEAESCSADYEGNTLPLWNSIVWAAGGNTSFPGPVVKNGCITLTPEFDAIASPFRTPLNEDNIAGRLSLQYRPNDDMLIFASLSRGYKSGAWPVITTASSEQLNAAKQEKVTAYELGLKTSLFDEIAQFNAAIFYYDYRDKQLLTEVEDLVFQTLPRLQNIDKSKVYGAEIDFNMQINENLVARLGGSYTKSAVQEYVGFRRLGVQANFKGDEFPYTPRWQFTGTLTHDAPITNKLFLISNLSVSYRSKSSSTIGKEEGFDIKSYALINGDISIYSEDKGWKIGLYGKNLLNTYYWTSVDVQTDSIYRIPGLPREFGVKFGYDF